MTSSTGPDPPSLSESEIISICTDVARSVFAQGRRSGIPAGAEKWTVEDLTALAWIGWRQRNDRLTEETPPALARLIVRRRLYDEIRREEPAYRYWAHTQRKGARLEMTIDATAAEWSGNASLALEYDVDDPGGDTAVAELLRVACANMDPAYRRVAYLRGACQLPNTEIARMIGVTPQRVSGIWNYEVVPSLRRVAAACGWGDGTKPQEESHAE